jgi:hypothetical protein
MDDSKPLKPSKWFCVTGELERGEEYNEHIHRAGNTPEARCPKFYDEYKSRELVPGQKYITTEGNLQYPPGKYLGNYIERKNVGAGSGGQQYNYIFKNGYIWDEQYLSDSDKLGVKVANESEGGGKMRSRKARRKRRRTLKKHRKTKSRK